MVNFFFKIVLASFCFAASTCFVDSFTATTARHRLRTTTEPQLQLWMSPPSRRDVLAGSASAAAAIAIGIHPTPAAAASSKDKYANESYQGVYFDPKHPDGYRVIMANGKGGATMTLCDSCNAKQVEGQEPPKTFRNLPVGVENDTQLIFDFGFKNGPKGIQAKLSDDKQSLVFDDGNTWTKNKNKYDGIYKVTTNKGGTSPWSNENAIFVLRKNGPEIGLEIMDGNSGTPTLIDGSVGTLFSIPTCELQFYFGGKAAAVQAAANTQEYSFMDALYDFQRGNVKDTTASTDTGGAVMGQLSLIQGNTVYPYGTITFPDKTVWTRL